MCALYSSWHLKKMKRTEEKKTKLKVVTIERKKGLNNK
jgi:hypothetical protein